MNKIKNVIGLVTSLVLAVGASSAFAANDKDKDKPKDKDKKEVVSVPEPATLGLLAAGAAAIGLRAVLRRRKP